MPDKHSSPKTSAKTTQLASSPGSLQAVCRRSNFASSVNKFLINRLHVFGNKLGSYLFCRLQKAAVCAANRRIPVDSAASAMADHRSPWKPWKPARTPYELEN